MTTMDPRAIAEALRSLTADPQQLQQRLKVVVESVQHEGFVGTALDGQVTATVSGLGALRSIAISTMAKRSTDNLTLGDAVTEAVRNAEQLARSALIERVLGDAADQHYGALLDPERLRRFLPD
jgi:DNA-binding protein YbaB